MANRNLNPGIIGPTGFSYLNSTLVPADYKLNAYDLTYSQDRLRVNAQMPDGSRFDTWRLAQMHPILTQNVSDFIVEFAADVFTGKTMSPTGQPVQPDGAVDTVDPTGEIKWYTAAAYANYPNGPNGYNSLAPLAFDLPTSGYEPYDSNPSDRYAEEAFVWRHDADTNTFDPSTNPGGSMPWPNLIRIRYRLHDDEGVVGEAPDDPGLWFEQIMAVNRN